MAFSFPRCAVRPQYTGVLLLHQEHWLNFLPSATKSSAHEQSNQEIIRQRGSRASTEERERNFTTRSLSGARWAWKSISSRPGIITGSLFTTKWFPWASSCTPRGLVGRPTRRPRARFLQCRLPQRLAGNTQAYETHSFHQLHDVAFPRKRRPAKGGNAMFLYQNEAVRRNHARAAQAQRRPASAVPDLQALFPCGILSLYPGTR